MTYQTLCAGQSNPRLVSRQLDTEPVCDMGILATGLFLLTTAPIMGSATSDPQDQHTRSQLSHWRLTGCVEHTLLLREFDAAHIQAFLPAGYAAFINASTGKAVIWVTGRTCDLASIDSGSPKPAQFVFVGPRINPPPGADPSRSYFYLFDALTSNREMEGRLSDACVDSTYANRIIHSYALTPPAESSALFASARGAELFSSTITAQQADSGHQHTHLLTWSQNTRKGSISINEQLFNLTVYAGPGTIMPSPSWIGRNCSAGLPKPTGASSASYDWRPS